MNKNGPIIIIEDNIQEQLLIQDIFEEIDCNNPLIFFHDCESAYDYILKTQNFPFIILSDINLPKLSGIELKEKLHNHSLSRLKCIPYLYFTTACTNQVVIDAYSKSVQGFFIKPFGIKSLENTLRKIISYWKDCFIPDSYAELV